MDTPLEGLEEFIERTQDVTVVVIPPPQEATRRLTEAVSASAARRLSFSSIRFEPALKRDWSCRFLLA